MAVTSGIVYSRIIRYGYGHIVTGYGCSLINSVLLGSQKWLPACIHACMDMHACLHSQACINACLHAYMLACMHAFLLSQACMLAFMHKCLPSCIYACLPAYMHVWTCMPASMYACLTACFFQKGVFDQSALYKLYHIFFRQWWQHDMTAWQTILNSDFWA